DITINNTVKPFTDARVRKALTLAIDRYTAGKVLHGLTGLRDVGALTRPGTEWAMAQSDLERFPGFARDAEKNRAEARRLLAEPGALLQSRERRAVRAAGADARPGRAPEARHRAPEDRARERLPHPRSLVVTQRRALGQGQELGGSAEPLHQSEAPGCVTFGGLICDVIGRSSSSSGSLS